MTEDIIFQSELEKQDINQISEKKSQNLTDFELKNSERVKFWIKNFTTRQIFIQNIYNASDFDEKYFFKSTILKKNSFLKSTISKEKIFLKSRFWKNFYTQKITFWFILPRKIRKFYVLLASLQSTILKKKKFSKKHDF